MRLVICLLWSLSLAASLNPNYARVTSKILELKEALLEFEHEFREDEIEVNEWLYEVGKTLSSISNEMAIASWNFETNISNKTQEEEIRVSLKASKLQKKIALEAKEKQKYLFLNKSTRRRLRLLAHFTDPTDETVLKKLTRTQSELENIYAIATVQKDGKTYKLEPDLTEVLKEERNPNVLEWAWKGWRDVTGKKMKSMYTEFIKLSNIGAVENGYSDYGEAWRSHQFDDTPDLLEMCAKLWDDVSIIYRKLHAFVRMRLKQYYTKHFPDYKFPTDGTIPAHLLGDMWAQQWQGIYEIVKPYPDVKETDVTNEMKKQNFDVLKLFKMANEFYKSLGLEPMTDTFWEKSMFVRPKDREVQCHASASDMYTHKSDRKKDDFRIKMCTEIDATYFETIHHEMGHIQYFMEYRDQPTELRTGANSAFHEAVGDTISLSVQTVAHLKTVGLIPDTNSRDQDDEKRDLNVLMKQALFKIAFLPFGYMIDRWRFKVFNGSITEENYNKEWWKHRLEYQGLSAPVTRTEDDFDPGAKFHIPSNAPYICYFVSFIAQFQFYESLCKESGHTGPLHTCDYYKSKAAGQKLRSFLKLGQSRPWKDALEVLTGTTEIKTNAIKEYFLPLTTWLDNELKGETLGWDGAKINFN